MNGQPILMALIKAGYVGAPCLQNVVIDEKNEKGVALIKLQHEDKPHNIYWDKDSDEWVEKKPAYYTNPNLVDKLYKSAV